LFERRVNARSAGGGGDAEGVRKEAEGGGRGEEESTRLTGNLTRSNASAHAQDSCKYCTLAKELLKGNAIEYQEVKLDPESAEYAAQRDALIERTGQKTFPWVFVQDELIGGYTDLLNAFNSSALHKKIGQATEFKVEEPDF
jgi:glutaredoxin 3